MPTPSYFVTIGNRKTIAPDVVEFTCTKPEGFTYKPGQFILFDVPHPDNAADIQTRAYSMASAADENELLFVVKLVPNGRFSRYYAEQLKDGSTLRMQGPFGFFVPDSLPGARIVLVATGTGLAPFRAHVRSEIASGNPRPIDLIFGVRGKADLFWIEELENITRTHPNFHLHPTLSAPDADWKGLTGRVQTHIPSCISDPEKTLLYACGNPLMTKEVKQLALEQWKIPKKNLHVEGYI